GAVVAAGHAPREALGALVRGSVSSPASLADSLAQSLPLIFTGLSVTLAFRCGVWNIGAEGQFLVGMLAATAVGLSAGSWPAWLAVTLPLLAGAGAGALWAAGPAAFRLLRGAPEV